MMAGDWIKMRLDLQTHPKVVRILSATKSDKFRAIGGLHAVWSVFDTHSTDGKLAGYTPETLDHIIGWQGFADAMIAVGWLGYDGAETLMLPEFDEHNGKSGKRRAEDQKRKRNDRKSPQPVRNSSANTQDAERTREEKRREDKEELQKPLGASAPSGTVLERRQATLDAIEEALPGEVAEIEAGKTAREEYPADFEAVWALYPARHGGNPKKDAFKHWNARRRDGVSAEEMLAGVQRYAAHLKAAGKLGTEYVMQAVRFFGTSRQYAEPWPVSTPNATVPNRPNGRPSINNFGSGQPDADDPFNAMRRAF